MHINLMQTELQILPETLSSPLIKLAAGMWIINENLVGLIIIYNHAWKAIPVPAYAHDYTQTCVNPVV